MVDYKDIGEHLVFSDGLIWSKYWKRFLKPTINDEGYERVTIGKAKFLVHQVVALSFLEWSSDMQVDHVNNIRSDNRVINLQMLTSLENTRKARNKPVIRGDGKIYNSGKQTEIDGFNRKSVSDCCRGRRNTHKGYTWRFFYE